MDDFTTVLRVLGDLSPGTQVTTLLLRTRGSAALLGHGRVQHDWHPLQRIRGENIFSVANSDQFDD